MTAIDDKAAQLRNHGFDLGGPLGPEQSAGFGGRSRAYQHATLYWHPATGAHEVHGGILKEYQRLGGPGADPQTGKRLLGYPKTDEIHTKDDRFPRSDFEWGTIVWVRGAGAVELYGAPYLEWQRRGAELGQLGCPLSTQTYGPGIVACFEHGVLWQPELGGPTVWTGEFHLPKIGKPKLVNPTVPDHFSWQRSLTWSINDTEGASLAAEKLADFETMWRDRLAIRRVTRAGEPVEMIPLSVQAVLVRPSPSSIEVSCSFAPQLVSRSLPPVLYRLVERGLYDIMLKLDQTRWYAIAAHGVYVRRSWDQFGFLHATDWHVARRMERFQSEMYRLYPTRAKHFVNYNDGARRLIKEANRLFRAGTIDFILATGDLVDFIFEKGDNEQGGGNFAYFRDILLGQAPPADPHGVSSEELLCPIFTTLGNHDYRVHPYELAFDASIEGLDDPDFNYYTDCNLLEEEAKALQGGSRITVSRDTAYAMVTPGLDKIGYYQKHIGTDATFHLALGANHIVMVNTRHDIGVVDSGWEAGKVWAGYGGEDMQHFASGAPSSKGFVEKDLEKVREALRSGDGAVIVCTHAPPINTKGSQYPHFLRETEHPLLDSDKGQVYAFLRRVVPDPYAMPMPYYLQRFPATGTKWFLDGTFDDLMDWGIAKGELTKFLRLCLGQDVPRPVDLVLSGHIHRQVEYRLRAGQDGRMLFHQDFYLGNPAEYYSSPEDKVDGASKVHIRVDPPNTWHPTHDADEVPYISIPEYATPLEKAADPGAWWRAHRPVFAQTGPLGPIEAEQRHGRRPSFRGYRVLQVRNGVVNKVQTVRYMDAAVPVA
jgi:hypothetical protein